MFEYFAGSLFDFYHIIRLYNSILIDEIDIFFCFYNPL